MGRLKKIPVPGEGKNKCIDGGKKEIIHEAIL